MGNELGGQQQALADLMTRAAQGNAPSAAEAMMRQAGAQQQANLRSALASQAASGRGLGMAARNAQAQQAATTGAGQMMSNQQAQIAQLRAQEMAQARAALGQQLSGMRGQDIQGYGLGQNEQAQLMQANQMQLEAAKAQAEMQQRYAEQKAQETKDIFGGIAQGIGTVASFFSDERVKENVRPADRDVKELLAALAAKHYDYKRGFGGKDNLGVMAQDLERSRVGRTMVQEVDTPEGRRKTVDMRKALAAALASSAHLNKRLSKLEGARHG